MIGENHKRKNYLINKKFQFKYTLSIVGMLLVVMLVSGAGLYMGMWGSIIENFSRFKVSENLENVKRIADYEEVRYRKGDYRLEKIFREADLLSQNQRDTLKNALKAVNRSLLPKVIILAILIFLAGIFISHKIAGPMYRFERSAEAITNGDLRTSFKIRKNDEMKGTASILDKMAEALRSDIEKAKSSSNQLKNAIDALDGNIPPEKAERLRRIANDINSVLSKYTI